MGRGTSGALDDRVRVVSGPVGGCRVSAANALSTYTETEDVGVEQPKPRAVSLEQDKPGVEHRLPLNLQFLRSQAHVSRHNARNRGQPSLIGAQSGLSLSQPDTPLQRRDSQGGESGHRRRSGAWRARAKGRQGRGSRADRGPSLTPGSLERGAPVVVVRPSRHFVHSALTDGVHTKAVYGKATHAH